MSTSLIIDKKSEASSVVKSDVPSEVKFTEKKKDFFCQVVEQTNSIGGEIQKALRLIKEANARAHMLSITAKIESNRLGDAGRDFLVVSNSIDELSTKTDDAIEKMKKETVEGIEKLGFAIEDKAMSINGNRLANLALSNIRIVDRNLFERAADVRWWATDEILVQNLSKNDSFSEASKRLEIMLESYPVYYDLLLCDKSGTCVASAAPQFSLIGHNFSQKPWFKNAIASKNGTEYAFETVHYSQTIRDYTVTFSCKIHDSADPEKPVIGVIAAVFKWKEFAQRIVNETGLTEEEKEKTRVLICDDNGHILADTNKRILKENFSFVGRAELFKKEIGFTVQTRNKQVQLISHALSPGFEGYCSTEWHSLIIQDTGIKSHNIKSGNKNNTDDSLDSITGLVVNLADETQKAISEINKINDQTQILSLNAAIEAARVGEAGRGFGVISGFMGDISRETAIVTDSMYTNTQEKIKKLNKFLIVNSQAIKGVRLSDLSLTNIDLVDRALYERTADVRWWATEHGLYTALTNNTKDNIDFLSKRLRTILQYYTVYEDLMVYDVEGNLISNASESKILEDSVADSTWFTNVQGTANGKSYGFDVVQINQNGKDEKHLVFSCKIHKDGNISQECIGILAILFKWEHFAKTIFKETPLTESERKHSSLFITSADGDVLGIEDNNDGFITKNDLAPFLNQTKNYDVITKDDFNWLIGNAASVGFEGFSTGWHSMIVENDLT